MNNEEIREGLRDQAKLRDAVDACNEAWNAFDNGKRKHHRDALSGSCIFGCQACAIEKLKRVLSANMKCATAGENYEHDHTR